MTRQTHSRAGFCAGLAVIFWGAGFGLGALPHASSFPPQTSVRGAGAAVVKTQSYVSVDQAPAGETFEAAVVVAIQRGFHMNAHKTSDEFLIPTTLTAQLPTGLKEVETIYPEGHLEKFTFSDKPINVYDGSITLKARLQTGADAAPGEASIPFVLRYQACNDTTCLPPVKVPVVVKVKVVAAGTKARPVHPEIFAARKTSPTN